MANKAVDAATYGIGAAIGGAVGGPLGAVAGVLAAHGVKNAGVKAQAFLPQSTQKDEEGNPVVNVNAA